MVKKCCVCGCQTICLSETKIEHTKKIYACLTVTRLPKKSKEKNKWIETMPNANLIVNESMVVCELHWPAGYETKSMNGKLRPKNPPVNPITSSLLPNQVKSQH